MNEQNSGGTWKLIVSLFLYHLFISFSDTVEAETKARTEVSSLSLSNSFGKNTTFDCLILQRCDEAGVFSLVAISS